MDLYDFCELIRDEEASRQFLRANGLLRSNPPGTIASRNFHPELAYISFVYSLPESDMPASSNSYEVG